jgi:hypothetical protein
MNDVKQVLKYLRELYLLNRKEVYLLVFLDGVKRTVIGVLKAIVWIVLVVLKLLLEIFKLLLLLFGLVAKVFLIFAKSVVETS